MHLVEVKRDEVFCDSHMVARKFNQKHAFVVNKIKLLERDICDLRVAGAYPKTITEDREYRGTQYKSYLMNREFFSLLMMRFKGKEAIEWQLKFNSAFYMMERRLVQLESNLNDREWIEARGQGKLVRRQETDVIKEFVEYAESQGSTKARWYYKHITNATYRALGLMSQRKPKLRDAMNICEVSQLILAEDAAKKMLRKYMDLGRSYTDIYECVKDDLILYARGLRLT